LPKKLRTKRRIPRQCFPRADVPASSCPFPAGPKESMKVKSRRFRSGGATLVLRRPDVPARRTPGVNAAACAPATARQCWIQTFREIELSNFSAALFPFSLSQSDLTGIPTSLRIKTLCFGGFMTDNARDQTHHGGAKNAGTRLDVSPQIRPIVRSW